MTNGKWKGHNYRYLVGLMFTKAEGEMDDPDAEQKPQKVGEVDMVVLSYNLDGTKIDGYYSNSRCGVEGNADLHDVLITRDKEISRSDRMDEYNEYYDFTQGYVLPRIIVSQYVKDRAYIVYGNQDTHISGEKWVEGNHVKVSSFNIARNRPEWVFRHEFYATYDYLQRTLAKYSGLPFAIDPRKFFLGETAANKVVLYNLGEQVSVAIENDISVYGQPKHIRTYWQDTDKLPMPRY